MNRTFRTPKGSELPISMLRNKEYLEVKYRLVWFREEMADCSIETEFIERTVDSAIAKATIKDASGRIIATSHKRETKQGFGDFLEKAETGAVGRALALIGFGTQFTGDDLAEGDRIVDSPIGHGEPGHGSEAPWPNEPPYEPASYFESYSAEQFNDNAGDYVINFGKKFKGLSIAAAVDRDGLSALQNYLHWLEDEATKKGKGLSTESRFFKVNLERYSADLATKANK